MEMWELDMISDTTELERERVAMRLAWVTASRWGEIASLQKENFVAHPQDEEALIVDWSALPKTFKLDPRRAARYVVIAGEDAKKLKKVVRLMVDEEKLTTISTRDVENILKPYAMTVHSIKKGGLYLMRP